MSTPRRPARGPGRPSRRPAGAAAGGPAEIEALLAQVEAELSGASKKALRRLVSKLADPAEDDALEWEDGAEDLYADGALDEGDGFDDDVGGAGYLWDGGDLYVPKAPIKVEGGLAARSKRGVIGETWWSRRFLDAVEPYLVGGRSGRGRNYARRGQVVELAIAPGLISAKVQGTRRVPYRVRIAMPVATADQW